MRFRLVWWLLEGMTLSTEQAIDLKALIFYNTESPLWRKIEGKIEGKSSRKS